MIATPVRRFGALLLMFFTLGFTGSALATTHKAKTTSHKSHPIKAHTSKQKLHHAKYARSNKLAGNEIQASSKQEYSRKVASEALPDLRKYPSGTPRKKAFLRTVMPYIKTQNAAITADRDWLMSKRYDKQWSSAERERLQGIADRYKIAWRGNTRYVPWDTLLERVDIIPTSMVATMAAAESGWGTSKLARANNNLFGMRCTQSHCNSEPGKVKGYSNFDSVKESVDAYVTTLNTHQAYQSFRRERAQLRLQDEELTAASLIHKLKGYSTQGQSYNNYLFAMFQSNQSLLATH